MHQDDKPAPTSRLALEEPEFYRIWIACQDPNDPQLERWSEEESKQLRVGRDTVEKLQRYFPVQGKSVLDVGCQWGATSIAMANAGAVVTGIDVCEQFVDGARLRAKQHGMEAAFHATAAETLPFEDGSFDVVVCVNVLEHVESHRKTVRELVRVLRPGGHLYLDGPNRLSPRWFLKDPHYRMMGISILPPSLGGFYVKRVRRFPAYEVGTFPIASLVEKLLRCVGAEIVASSRNGGGAKQNAREQASRLNLADWTDMVRFNTAGMFYFVARKRDHQRETV